MRPIIDYSWYQRLMVGLASFESSTVTVKLEPCICWKVRDISGLALGYNNFQLRPCQVSTIRPMYNLTCAVHHISSTFTLCYEHDACLSVYPSVKLVVFTQCNKKVEIGVWQDRSWLPAYRSHPDRMVSWSRIVLRKTSGGIGNVKLMFCTSAATVRPTALACRAIPASA